MKLLYLLSFFLFLSCISTKKEYVCGNRPCVDKKEFDEYFAENLTIEIVSDKNKKNQIIDLAKLNTNTKDQKNNNINNSKMLEREKKQIKKNKLRIERNRLLKERKIKKAEKKHKIKEDKKALKILKIDKRKKKTINSKDINVANKKDISKNELNKKLETKLFDVKDKTNICDQIKDCDINIIAETLIKKGKEKPFPNIASK